MNPDNNPELFIAVVLFIVEIQNPLNHCRCRRITDILIISRRDYQRVNYHEEVNISNFHYYTLHCP